MKGVVGQLLRDVGRVDCTVGAEVGGVSRVLLCYGRLERGKVIVGKLVNIVAEELRVQGVARHSILCYGCDNVKLVRREA
jgi:hypothetical protein